jgi:predicted Zn finger-like uncharacterized protein
MKFACDHCQTRYSIGDDKVKGKVLKIRCKTCGNIIVVREQLPTVQGEASGYAVPHMMTAAGAGPSVGSPAPTPAPPPSAASPRPGAVAWFLAIKGKQHGPATVDDVVRFFREGKITERTYLWHEQLTSWVRLKDLPEFAAVVAEGPAPRRPPPPPPDEGAQIVDFEAARAQRQQQQQQQPQPQPQPKQTDPGPVLDDPFAAVSHGPDGQVEGNRESTRVFIMQAGLHNRGTKHKLYAGIAAIAILALVAIGVIDYQLDILGLRQVVDAVAVSTGIKQAPVDDGPGWDDADVDPALKCRLNPNPAECIKQQQAKNEARRTKKGGKKPTDRAGASLSDDDLKGAFGASGSGAAGTIGSVASASVGSDGFVSVGAGTPSAADVERALAGSGKGGPTGPKVGIETPSVAGTTIDADNASKVVRDGQGGIQACVDSAMKNGDEIPGKVRVTLSIGLKGTVERAVSNNAVVGASTLGGCLTSTMKKWKFAPPTEAADLEIPLILR